MAVGSQQVAWATGLSKLCKENVLCMHHKHFIMFQCSGPLLACS